MILGAHNAWSYLTPRKWWMRLIAFTARCQRINIKDQYNKYGVRCFDLRIRFDKNNLPIVCHGIVEYKYDYNELYKDLQWLQDKKDAYIRLLLELRGVKKEKWITQKRAFNSFYNVILKVMFPDLKFLRGRSLPDWDKVIRTLEEKSETEDYASVSAPKYIDDWIPILYAMWHNRIARNTDERKEIKLLDFIDVY